MSAEERAGVIVDALVSAGTEVVASLPDSWLSALIARCAEDERIRHVGVTREDDAMGIAAGMGLGGGRAAVVCQSAGVLLAANALAGYRQHHQLPFVVVAAHRGGRDDRFPYQAYKHRSVSAVLDALAIPTHVVDDATDHRIFADAVEQAWVHRSPVVVLCSRNALEGGARR